MTTKTRVAFVKFGGMADGPTEKFLQDIAEKIPKRRFLADYYYCDSAPYIGSDWKHPNTNPGNVERLKEAGVNTIKFNVEFKNVTVKNHDWVNTDFWDKFDESKYDIIQTARAGHPEYPFDKILVTPIVDSLHLTGMVDRQANIVKVIHISDANANAWVQAGGDKSKVVVVNPSVSLPPESSMVTPKNLRGHLGIKGTDMVFGMIAEKESADFSEWPIGAYAELEKKAPDGTVHFVLLGGNKKHLNMAQGLKHFHALPGASSREDIWNFLHTLDVYTHGNRQGSPTARDIVQAMACGLPVVSHLGLNNKHVEIIGDCGFVHDQFKNYVIDCAAYYDNKERQKVTGDKARKRSTEMFGIHNNIKKVTKIYDDVMYEKKLDTKTDDDFWGDMWEERKKDG